MVFLQRIKELVTLGSGDVIGSVLSAIFWFYLASQIKPDAYGEIHWFLGIVGIFSYVALFGTLNTITVYSAKNRKLYSTYSKYVLTQKGLTLGLGLAFFYYFGYDGILFALALSYVFYIKRIFIIFREQKINFNLVKERIGFITNNYMMFLLAGFNGQIDKIIIAPLLGFTLLGNYSLALQAITIMMIFSAIFYKYILPQDSSGKNTKNLKIFAIIVSISISLVGIFLGPILVEVFFPKYLEAKDAIQIMSVSIAPSTIALILESQFLGSEKSRVVLIGAIISLVILICGMIILGLNFGIIGLAWSLIIATSAKTVFLLFAYYKNKNGVNYVRT